MAGSIGYAEITRYGYGQPAPAPEYSEDGVDLSLIRWMLSLTPAERLEFLEERINDILAVRELNDERRLFPLVRALALREKQDRERANSASSR